MTMVSTTTPMFFPRVPIGMPTSPGSVIKTLDAVGEKFAFIFRAPKTGTIDRVHFSTGAITTGGTVDVRLETLSLTDGNPTGTLLGTNSNGAVVVDDTDDNVWKSATLTTGVSVTIGDLMAAVIVVPAGFAGAIRAVEYDTSVNFPYSAQYTTVWTKSSDSPCMAIQYSDNSYADMIGAYPIMGLVLNTALTTTALVSNRLNIPFNCTVNGFWAIGDFDQNTIFKLFDSDGTTVLMSGSIDSDVRQAGTGRGWFVKGDAIVTLTRNTAYRVAIGSTGANGGTIQGFNAGSNAVLDACGNKDTYSSTAATQTPTGTGDWTDTNTTRYMIGLVIGEIDDGAGTGGGGGTTAHTF